MSEVTHFTEHGWLHETGALATAEVDDLLRWVAEVEAWAEVGTPGLHHWEQTDQGPALARTEDLVPHHDGLRAFITTGKLLATVSALFGEPGVLFKEKINHKRPGGAGFAPHQDAAAYRFVDHHISCMVPIDVADVTSGCLDVVSGAHGDRLPTTEGGRITEEVAAGLDWQPAPVAPGDILWFDSYTPHRSGTNTSTRPRRALYLTYNAASKGDFRDRYYADKRAEFAAADGTFGGDRVRISISDDFLGRPVERGPAG